MKNSKKVPILSVRNLKKTFSGKTVVDGVSFDVYPGEIIALAGENGAGKSTLKNMLCGLLKPSGGKIFVEGKEIQHINGFENGISAVHQELSLFQSLSVAANICMSQLPGSAVKLDWKLAHKISKKQLDFLGIDIDTNVPVESLGIGKQQIVEIAKALIRSDKLLILDEPTTSLTQPEREKLFAIMRRLKEKGIAIIFISHFMDEIFRMSDKYIVLRDGKQVGEGYIKDITRNELESMMVGRTIGDFKIDIGFPKKEEVLRVENLNSYDFYDISFSVNKGEILGIAGLIGAGRTEVIESIFGVRKSQGNIYINNDLISPVTVKKMKDKKVCLVTEDRKSNGIFSNRSVRENISAANIHNFIKRKIKGFGFKEETERTQEIIGEMNISIPHIESKITNLSGGNQQKVILGRWLATAPQIIILDEPTKGVDIGAKFDIHNMIAELAKNGVAIIIVSSDLPELISLSHRILVMREGHIVGEFSREEFDSVKIISMAASSAYEKDDERKSI